MIEIIILIFFAKQIGILAKSKGLKVGLWRFYLILSWIVAEFFGFFVGLMFFDLDNIFSIMLVGIIFAVTSYFILKSYLEKLPDYDEDDEVNRIGRL